VSDEALIREPSEMSVRGPGVAAAHGDDEMPRAHLTRRYVLALGFFVASSLAFLYFVLPKLTGLSDTWARINHGEPGWLAVAAALEVCSFAGYIVLFRTVFVRGGSRIDWRESYQITMAGLAATRLFAAAGAGGVALTAWALRRSGMERRIVACRMVAFMAMLYFVYMAALVIDGVGIYAGVFRGHGSFAITMIPAIFGAVLIAACAAIALVPADLERRLLAWAQGHPRVPLARWGVRPASVPATVGTGLRTALRLVRQREVGVLGAIAWWAFDIAVLWACFHAFGENPPPLATIVMAYYVGMLANTLPLPGGIGGVEGGMIGAFLAFNVSGGLSIVAVLTYRAFSFWLPTIPGAIAYVQLRRTVARWRRPERRPDAATA
jgi:uncharacterized membrane protein YbhN (UPF0104 family)